MNDEILKIKLYIKPLKWAVTIFFLAWNLILLAMNRCEDQSDFITMIIVVVIANVLAILSFILLSVFPNYYYIFDNNGVTFQNRKGIVKFHVDWDNIYDINYVYGFGIYPEGLKFEYKPNYQCDYSGVIISPKQARLVYQTIPKVREIIGKKQITW